jgi:glutamyl-Q tRNA(Asp) synthetase
MLAFDMARQAKGEFLLRMEDIDRSRARSGWEDRIYEDLRWLGLTWPEPVLRQSQNMAAYKTALDRLWDLGVLYHCYCSRRDIQAAASAPQEGVKPLYGPDGLIYPGTCRQHVPSDAPEMPSAVRLNMEKAFDIVSEQQTLNDISFNELSHGSDREVSLTRAAACREIGDVVVARRDMGTSYHLSVVVDDSAQGISHVVRGEDLFEATKIHIVLQRLLGLTTPKYFHHRLIRDETGKRLAKRDDARSLAKYRADGLSPQDIRCLVGLA